MASDRWAAARLGAVTGIKVVALGSVIYLLLLIVWYVVDEFRSDPNLFLGSVLTLVFGLVLGVLPAVLAGLITGGLLGFVLGLSSERSWALGLLAGIVLASLAVAGVRLVVLHLTGVLQPLLYLRLIGLPMVIFVAGFGWIGIWLQKKLALPR